MSIINSVLLIHSSAITDAVVVSPAKEHFISHMKCSQTINEQPAQKVTKFVAV